MFEFTIKSSKDLKKLTIEFESDGSQATIHTTSDSSVQSVEVPVEKDIADVLANRIATGSVKSEPLNHIDEVKEDIADRPPSIDKDFGSQSF